MEEHIITSFVLSLQPPALHLSSSSSRCQCLYRPPSCRLPSSLTSTSAADIHRYLFSLLTKHHRFSSAAPPSIFTISPPVFPLKQVSRRSLHLNVVFDLYFHRVALAKGKLNFIIISDPWMQDNHLMKCLKELGFNMTADVKKETVFYLHTADVSSISSVADVCRYDSQTTVACFFLVPSSIK
uniref:Uncharacterized protein n=1 Tax=Lactuca sativa TaxID=4236 RepID=A0A9R1V2D0_LACSA|nr:hypothetical protein LSAT_V11C700378020 [Lactuca sativa]